MPLPNPVVVSAYFESYITIRKSAWGLKFDDKGNVKIPDSQTPTHKINICTAMLLKFKQAKTFNDWLDVLDKLYENEKAEEETRNNRTLIARWMTNDPLLAKVLKAARTSILAQLKDLPEFKQLNHDLGGEKHETQQTIKSLTTAKAEPSVIEAAQKKLAEIDTKLETRNYVDIFNETFFTAVILKEDPLAVKHNENNAADFERNAAGESRPLTICSSLIKAAEIKNANQAATTKADKKDASADKATTATTAATATKPEAAKPATKPAAALKTEPAPAAKPIALPTYVGNFELDDLDPSTTPPTPTEQEKQSARDAAAAAALQVQNTFAEERRRNQRTYATVVTSDDNNRRNLRRR